MVSKIYRVIDTDGNEVARGTIGELAESLGVTINQINSALNQNYRLQRKYTIEITDEILTGWYHECEECGKKFYVPDIAQWVYKVDTYSKGRHHMKTLCSWTCYRKVKARWNK